MATDTDPGRVRLLEEQIRELQLVHTQLVTYAEDLNRTYLELRLRLQQMTVLSAIATQLVRARSVDNAARTSLDSLSSLFPRASGRIYLEDRRGTLKMLAERSTDGLSEFSDAFDAAAEAARASLQPLNQVEDGPNGPMHVVSVGLEARGRTFGALVVARATEEFSEHDLHVVELLGHGVAVAIENARLYQETRRLAITDSTTGIFNFRYFRTTLAQEIQKARRLRYPIALLMVDIDHFKDFNDLHGHPKGNVALRAVARAIVSSLRQTDIVARYGGEEFAVILPGCDHEALQPVAEKIRESVAKSPIRIGPGKPPAHVTISLGGAWQSPTDADASVLLSVADGALYQAKALGRNRACVVDS
jgi:diguanylate cyclase (GGDEF)-like protein